MIEIMTALMVWNCSISDSFCAYDMVEMFVEPEECWDQEEIINADNYDENAFCMEMVILLE